MIETKNDGPRILSSIYWGSDYDRAGKLFASVNAGTARLLLPDTARAMLADCRSAKYAILSRGPWPAQRLPEAVEILFEDGTDSPFTLHLSPESFDQLPAEPPEGRGWRLALWTLDAAGRPTLELEMQCRWRRVPKLPWLKAW